MLFLFRFHFSERLSAMLLPKGHGRRFRRRRPKSIHFWLTLLVIACILPSAIGAAFLLVRNYEEDRDHLEAAHIGVARALMQAIDGELSGASSVLRVLSESLLLTTGDLAAFHERATRAVATTSATHVVLSLPDGQQVLNTLKPFGTMLPSFLDEDLRRRTIETGGLVVSGVFYGPVAEQPITAVQMPIFKDGQIKYTLSIAFSSHRLGEMLLRQNMPAGWVAAIFDQNGIVAARTKAANQFVGKPGAAAAVRFVRAVPEGAFVGATLEGQPAHIVVSRSAFSDWAVVIAVPAAVATAELRHALWLNGFGALAVLLLGAALARLIGMRISRSITALAEPALALGSGKPLRLPPSSIIEVDTLRGVLLNAEELIEQRARERDVAKDAERRMVISAEASEQASRSKSEFLAAINHELRTPLHGILGYAEMMRLDGDLAPAQARRVDLMLNAGEHLLGMINSVLDLSQIEANMLEVQPETVEILDIARRCLDLVRPGAEKKGLALVMAPAVPAWLCLDATRFQQVLVNLLGNAIKFTAAGSVELRLGRSASGDCFRVAVADTGPGVPPRHRDKLFHTFQRLDGNALRSVEGAGLGLALSARLVALMGGHIGYEPNPMGGSIFWLELPLDESAAPALPIFPPPANLPAPTRALHVLVVDDVAMNRDIAASFLIRAGHLVTCAESGEAAITAAAGADFDVILMDVRMPGIDGLQATRSIRMMEGPRGRVPVVALTAQAFSEQVAECAAAGMNDHLGKPFNQTSLLAVVSRVAHADPVAVPDPQPVAPVSPPVAQPLLLNLDTFRQTTSYLPPHAAAEHLRTILGLVEALAAALRDAHAVVRDGAGLADAAHKLVGGAGAFGFDRLVVTGRAFERAVHAGAVERDALAAELREVTEATILEIRELMVSNDVT